MTERLIAGLEDVDQEFVINEELRRYIVKGGLIAPEVLMPLVKDTDEFDRQLCAIDAELDPTTLQDILGSKLRMQQMASLRERYFLKQEEVD